MRTTRILPHAIPPVNDPASPPITPAHTPTNPPKNASLHRAKRTTSQIRKWYRIAGNGSYRVLNPVLTPVGGGVFLLTLDRINGSARLCAVCSGSDGGLPVWWHRGVSGGPVVVVPSVTDRTI